MVKTKMSFVKEPAHCVHKLLLIRLINRINNVSIYWKTIYGAYKLLINRHTYGVSNRGCIWVINKLHVII